jgi:uncharacterized protein (DUF1330 family)
MNKPVFLMIEATPNMSEMEALQSYQSQVPGIAKKHGAAPVASYNVEAALDGAEKPAIFAILSFPSHDAIDSLFSDPDYEALIPMRNLGFSHVRFFIVNEKI